MFIIYYKFNKSIVSDFRLVKKNIQVNKNFVEEKNNTEADVKRRTKKC